MQYELIYLENSVNLSTTHKEYAPRPFASNQYIQHISLVPTIILRLFKEKEHNLIRIPLLRIKIKVLLLKTKGFETISWNLHKIERSVMSVHKTYQKVRRVDRVPYDFDYICIGSIYKSNGKKFTTIHLVSANL